jgi:hypothetical protein
VNGG